MKKTALRYGLYSSVFMVGMFIIGFMIFMGPEKNYKGSEIFGYSSMVVSMVFVFFGIKHFRDQLNGGMLSFGKGMKVGLLIVLIPSLAFGLFTVIYMTAINPDYTENYYNYQLSQMQANMNAAEFDAARTKMEQQRAMFANPAFSFIVMALTVFVIGVIATVISSLILKRTR